MMANDLSDRPRRGRTRGNMARAGDRLITGRAHLLMELVAAALIADQTGRVLTSGARGAAPGTRRVRSRSSTVIWRQRSAGSSSEEERRRASFIFSIGRSDL